MLALIFIAMVAKQAGRRKQVKAMRMEAMVNAELDDETQRASRMDRLLCGSR